MATKYRLPCDCGRHVEVDARRAGQTLPCECGQSIDVPTMRQLRQHERVGRPEADDARSPSWSLRQGVVFVIGSVLVVISLIIGVLQFSMAHSFNTAAPIVNKPWHRGWADSLSPEQSWDAWQEFSDLHQFPLEQPGTPTYLVNRRKVSRHTVQALIALGVAIIGVVVVVGSFVLRPEKKRRRRPPGKRAEG